MQLATKSADLLTPEELAFAHALEAGIRQAAATYHLQPSHPGLVNVHRGWLAKPEQVQAFELFLQVRTALEGRTLRLGRP